MLEGKFREETRVSVLVNFGTGANSGDG